MAKTILEVKNLKKFWWLRVHLVMQETQVQSLLWEDPTCCRATKPLYHNY